MVKLTAPCFSMDARGSVGDTLTYAKIGNTNYAKSHFSPSNPKSNAQVGVRCMVTFLTKYWSSLSPAEKASFEPLAEELNLTPYHAWLKLNCGRWARHEMPVLDTTNDYQVTNFGIYLSISKTGRQHNIDLYCDTPHPPAKTAEICFDTQTPPTGKQATAKIILHSPIMSYPPDANFIGQWTAPDDQTYYAIGRYAIASGKASNFQIET